jgi:nucleoside-diphosphate-sugar epimerase
MKTLLFTGSTGFVGNNILPFLKETYNVSTLGRKSANILLDISSNIPEIHQEFDIILHAAGKAHSVSRSEKDIEEFYAVNYQGTKNLCAGLEKKILPQYFIFISTVAVYGREYGNLITEDCPLNTETPYGRSKKQAEEYLLEWCYKNNISLTILRPSLLAGKSPPGNLGTMIEGIAKSRYVSIAGGKAKKSIAMVDDIGRLIPYCENSSGIFNLCDNYNPTFRELEQVIAQQLHKPLPVNIPLWSAKCLAKAGDFLNLNLINMEKLGKITQTLTFSNEKIKKEMNFIPLDVLTNFSIF